jgi:hypothetical protein
MSSPLSRSRLLLFATAVGLLALPLAADAKKKEPESQKPAATGMPPAGGGATDKPFQDWNKLTKGAEVSKGYFNLYKKHENLYLELKPDQMNQPVLGIFSCARGIGSNFLLGGLPIGDKLIEFQRAGDHVLVIEQNTRFAANGDPAFAKAKDLSIGNSVLASLKIESEQDSTKAVLVDLAPFLVSDLTDIAEFMHGALGGKSVRFDKERSALGSIKVFPENAEIEALLTYSPNDRQGLDIPSVPDERFIPITVHYSFSKLPAVPMKPRLADDRVGYFLTAIKDFARDDQESFWVRYIHRWRLERKEPTQLASEGGASTLAEPVKPIVYYIDRTVPVAYRPYIKQGIERWQKAFEAAGFKNAIIAKDAPDDPNWDPEDVRYSTIRWITSSEPSFGAIGPSRVDPRSGEILDADILMEASFVQSFRNIYRRYAGPEAIADGVMQTRSAWPAGFRPDLACDAMGSAAADGGALLNIGLLVDGALPPGSPVPDEYLGQALIWATMHEVGHTLGLRHNFRSSTSTPYDKLEDKAWTSQHGLASSVMDYMTPNIALDRSKQGEYYTSTVGDEDVWAIRYGYAPGSGADPAADYKSVQPIADESTKPGHEYSTDEDTYPVDALDPRTNIFDLGNDPLRFAKDRTTYVAGLWKSGKLEDRILGPQGEYPVLRRAMDTLLGQYAVALGMAVKYVGGQYVSRNHRGQTDAKAPLIPVPAAKQREALDFLAQRAFAADAFTVAPTLLNDLVQDRWSHWGVQDGFSGSLRLDYNLNDRVLAIQDRLLTLLLSQPLLARLREAESRSPDAFRVSEHFDRLTKMLWGDVGATPAELKALDTPGTRREIQRAYVDKLAALVVGPASGVPDDARALARLQLTRIDARASKALAATTPMGDYTRAHLTETRARIKRALDAQRIADAPAPAAPAGFGRGAAAEGH